MMTRWLAAIVCATALVLTSCGGGDGKSSLTLVQGAGDAVIAAETARAEMRFESSGQSFTMEGQLDFANATGSFAMNAPGIAEFEGVYTGTEMFVRTGGGGWTLIQMEGDLAEQALQGLGADPLAILEQLSGAGGIKDKGSEEIRGVETTHYSGDVDLVKALEAQGMPQEQIDQFKEQVASAGKVTSTIDVYIDANGLAHRTVSHFKMAGAFEMTMTMDLLDFGEPVNITVPAPEDVVRTEAASTQYEVNQLMQSLLVGG